MLAKQHTKLAQAFSRAGQEEKSAKAHDRSEELKQLCKRFAKLHEEAADKPYDAKLRREMAQTAEFLGRKDLAQVWTKAADSLDPPEASKDEPAK